MSYIENLTGSEVQAGLQETLSLGVGNFKIRGFDLTNTGDYLVLSSGIALIDGLRVISTGNLQVATSTALNRYIFLRINTYTRLENGITVRKANLSLIVQTLNIPVNNDDLYENITGTKDVLLAYVNDSGVVDLTTNGTLGVYDVPTRLTSVEGVNATQDTSISSLDTRMDSVEAKNTTQDNRLNNLENGVGKLLIQYGSTTITPVANTPTYKAITFPKAYTSPPVVFVNADTVAGGQYVQFVNAQGITTTNFKAFIYRLNTLVTDIDWVAIGIGNY